MRTSYKVAVSVGAQLGLCLLASTSLAQTAVDDRSSAPNSRYDDYAPAFRQLPNGGAELWFTSGLAGKSGRSRLMMISRCTVNGFDAPVPLDDANINFVDPARSAINDVSLNGVPSFTCDGTRGVFVSNRLVGGKDMGNDIYEMWQTAGGHWEVHRLDEVNSEYWDDTPTLSFDGNILFFSSDRHTPGTRHAELFYSRRSSVDDRSSAGGWSAPKPIEVFAEASGSHEAPCVGPDGYFYFATTGKGHHYELWRAALGADGLPTSQGEPVPFAGVNSDTTDATHPCFSPGGNWFLYCTNRGENGKVKDQDIRWAQLRDRPLTLRVNVQQRIRKSDPADPSYTYDATEPLSTSVSFRDPASGATLTEHSDAKGNCAFQLKHGATPASDLPLRVGLLSAVTPSPRFVSATDTLIYILDSKSDFERTLFVWDTSSYYDPSCRQTFPIADVRFFIEGYWGPTTYKYRSFLDQRPGPKCPSFFTDSVCTVAERKCDDNNLYAYKYVAVKEDGYSECFNYKEFRTYGKDYADEVDAKLDTLRTDMQSALMRDCVVRAKRQKQKVEIRVIGYTDPKRYKDQECEYNGETIDFSNETVRLFERKKLAGGMDTDIAQHSVEAHFVNGTLMTSLGGGGNALLSWARAYWAAVLLDSIWNSSVPAYRDLREKGLLVIKAEGKSVNPDEKRSFAARRSIEVEVSTETNEVFHPGMRPQPGQVVELWNQCDRPDKLSSATE